MKMFLAAFGLHNPFIGKYLQAHAPIPIASDCAGGFDLDYSALLIAESLIIDRGAFEHVRERRTGFLKPMFHSLEVLQDEGLLEIVDYNDAIANRQAQILAKTDQMVEELRPWLSIARKQWRRVGPEFEEFANLYSRPGERFMDAAHSGVVSYLARRDGRATAEEVMRLHGLLLTRRTRLKSAEEDDLKGVLKPLIAQVLINDLLRRWLDAPFLDWDDAQDFHDRLHVSQWLEFEDSGAPSGQLANQARCLFHSIIPELLPGRIEDVVKFLSRRSTVRSLRNELWQSLRNGESVSKDWMLALQSEATAAQLRAETRGRAIKWIGRAINLIPAGGVIGDLTLTAAEEVAERLSDQPRTRFEWYYVLQRLKMANNKTGN